MNLPRAMTLLVVVSLLLQPIFPVMASSSVKPSHALKATSLVGAPFSADEDLLSAANTMVSSTSGATVRGDWTYLPVIYKTGAVKSASASNTQSDTLPRMSATEPITNGEDIMYLVNIRQIARTRNFSDTSPTWASLITTGVSISGTRILDFILDPNDPYNTAWAVGDTGIWRTTNLNAEVPSWSHNQTMHAITMSLPLGSYDKDAVVSRIAGDVSRPGFFLVVLGTNAGGDTNQHAWAGYTKDHGSSWSWIRLPNDINTNFTLGTFLWCCLGEGKSASTSLTMSQDGSGRIWIGAWAYSFVSSARLIYSEDYGQSWQIIWSYNFPAGTIKYPTSLYYSRGTLFATMGISVGKSLDNGKTWQFSSGAVTPRTDLNYGINGPLVTNQLVYYLAANTHSLQYSMDGGVSFNTRSASPFPGAATSAAHAWYDNPDKMVWSRTGGFSSAGDVLFFSENQGQSWQNKTGNWNSVFGDKWSGGDVFITLPSQVAHLRDQSLSDRSRRGKQTGCALNCPPPVHWVNDPVDTSNGNLSYQVIDFAVASLGGELAFQRSYASFDSNIPRPLGYGWANNFDERIIAPITTAHPVTVALQTANGSLLQFFRVVSTTTTGTYAPDLGVTAELTRVVTGSVVTYTLVDKLQTTYVFTTSGALLSKRSSLGYLTTYSYGAPDRLTQVTDVSTGRWLQFTYDPQDRMQAILDHSGRTIAFTYDLAGDLTNLIDTRGLTWTYVYTGSHLLWKVIDPDNRTVVRTEYDEQGRAIEQYDGLDNRTVKLDFGLGSTRILTDARNFTSTDTYVGATWIGSLDANSRPITRHYDLNSRPVYLADQNGNGAQMLWSPNGHNLERVVDAGGFTTTLLYDGLNNPTLITDTRGFTTTYGYSGSMLTRTVDALGNTAVYTYGPNNLLVAQQDALGRVTRYEYDSFGQRTVMTDALTNVTRFEYDSVGRLITTTDAIGRITVSAYDNTNHLIAVTNNHSLASSEQNYLASWNLITRYGYDGFGRQIAVTDTLTRVTRSYFDAAGRLISTTQNFSPAVGPNHANTWNLIVRYGYDAVGNQVAVTDTLGSVTRTDYDSLNRPVTVTQNYQDGNFNPDVSDEDVRRVTHYDPAGNVLEQIDALGRVTRNWYDSLNRVISTTTNYTTVPGADPNTYNLTTWYEYDPAGQQVAITDTQQHVTRNYYDPLGRLISTTANYRSDVGPNYLNAYNLTTRYEYDRVGNRVAITDAQNTPTRYTYDALNRVIATTNVSGTTYTQYDAIGNRRVVTDALQHTTVYTYDAVGRLSVEGNPVIGNSARYQYDALGRTVVVTDPIGHASHTFYDEGGRVVSTTDALTGTTVSTYDALGRRIRVQDARGNGTNYQYDGLGRTIVLTDATGSVIRSAYDALGNRTRVIDGLNHAMTSTYDALNRLVMAQDALGNATRYGYDKVGNRVVMTDANGMMTGYGYDDLSRLVVVTESMTSTTGLDPAKYNVVTRYGYDALGNRTVMTDALQHVTTYTYDRLSRLLTLNDPLTHTTRYVYDVVGNRTQTIDANNQTITYTYDALNRNTQIDYGTSTVTYEYDAIGNRKAMTDSLGVTRYVYDELNRLTQVTDPFTGTVQYRYDAVGNRTNLIYPDGKVVTYTFDAANRLTGTLNWDGQLTTYDFDQAGRLITTTLPNGVTEVTTYDDGNRTTNLTHSRSGTTLTDYQYELDKSGNRTVALETQQSLPLFADGFESGNFLAWSAAVTNSGNLFVTSEAALSGTYGMRASLDTNPMYVRDDTPNALPQYAAAFQLRVNESEVLTLFGQGAQAAGVPGESPEVDTATLIQDILVGRSGANDVFRMQLKAYYPGYWFFNQYYVQVQARRDDGTYASSGWVSIASGQVLALDVAWQAASPGADNGVLTWRLNGVAQASLTNLDNDTLRVDEARLGPSAASLSGGLSYLVDFTQDYDGFVSSTTPWTRINYSYDPLYRLTQATYSGVYTYTFGYSYDQVGNRTVQTRTITNTQVTNYVYDAANRLSSAGNVTYTWDNNGNLINDGSSVYDYDRANRLISTTVVASGQNAQFTYNGEGVRLGQTRQLLTPKGGSIPEGSSGYVQDVTGPLPVVLQETATPPDVGFTISTQYLYSIGTRPLGQYTSAWEYLLPDALGSVRQIVDADGNVTLAESYEPYGNVLTSTGTASSIFGYSGEQIDTTGLIYLRARYMNPRLGIFLARDPWSGDELRPETFNGFNYAGGNPIVIVDPSGRCYPPLQGLRQIEPVQCANLDLALLILGDPRSTPGQRLAPSFYVGLWTTSHAMFVVGSGILAGGIVRWGWRYLTAGGAAEAAKLSSEHPTIFAEVGNCIKDAWNGAQQVMQQITLDETGSMGGQPIVIELGSGDFSNLPQIVADNQGARVIGIESVEIGELVAAGHKFPGGSSIFDTYAQGYDAAIESGAEVMFQNFGQGLPLRADKIISIAPNPYSVPDVVEAIKSAIKPGGEVYIAVAPWETTGENLQRSLSQIYGAIVNLSEGTSRYPSSYLPQGIANIIHFIIPK